MGCIFSSWSRGSLQTFASTRKNFIEKRRNKCGCCCEFFSHLILFLLLLFGYRLSKVEKFPIAFYDVLDLNVPPIKIKLPQSTAATNQTFPIYNTTGTNILRNATSTSTTSVSGIFPSLTKIIQGPLLIPSFDLFVASARFLTSAASGSAATELALQTSQGQYFGNLIRFGGAISFAPRGPLVNDLIHYLNETTSTFRSINTVIFDSEAAAVNDAVSNGNPFALIVVNEVSPEQVFVDIRMDYRTVPNTNLIIDDTGKPLAFPHGALSNQPLVQWWA